MDASESALVEAVVNRDRVGDKWPIGLVALIELHEQEHLTMVSRKQIHVLIDRYAERYFPDVVVGHEHRRLVIQTLRERWYTRLTKHWRALSRSSSVTRL